MGIVGQGAEVFGLLCEETDELPGIGPACGDKAEAEGKNLKLGLVEVAQVIQRAARLP